MHRDTQTTTRNSRHHVINLRERTWYAEPARELLIQRLEQLATDPVRHRPRSIAIIGEANSGKSSIIKRYIKLHPEQRTPEGLVIPAISVNMTKVARVEDLSVRLLDALHAPDPERGTHADRMNRFTKLARQVKLSLTFLDEFHDAAKGETKRGMQFLQLVKSLLLENYLVVPVGIEALAELLSRDIQILSRLNLARGRLPRIEQVEVVRGLMRTVLGSDDFTEAAALYVLHETKGVLGHVLDLVEDTVTEYGRLDLASLKAVRAELDALNQVV